MMVEEFARIAGARKTGRGKWIAKCPAHPDRRPSLSIAAGRKVPVLVRCMSNGCDTKSILEALGLRWGDLFYGRPTPEIRRILGLEDQRNALERELGFVIVLEAIEDNQRRYWAAAEKRIQRELANLRCILEPEKVYQEWRARMIQERAKKYGWELLWKENNL